MTEINKEQLDKIIDRRTYLTDSSESDEKLKGMLKELFTQLGLYNESVMKELQSEILSKKNSVDELPVIITALIDRQRLDKFCFEKDSQFAEMAINQKPVYFLRCSYEEIKQICGEKSQKPRKYKGHVTDSNGTHTFDYYFKFNDCHLRAEKMLEQLAKTYHLPVPIVYSPFSHKSFDLIDNIDSSIRDRKSVSYDFEANGLKDIVLCNKVLLWNVRSSDSKVMQPVSKKPYLNLVKYQYQFTDRKPNQYIVPSEENELVYEVRNDMNETDLWLQNELGKFRTLTISSIDQNRVDIKELLMEGFIYHNEREVCCYPLERIRSWSDINYAVAVFSGNPYISLQVDKNNNGRTVIKRYSKKYAYQLEPTIRQRTVGTSYITFQCSGEQEWLLSDYANYILTYLDIYYPEIEWVGLH
ncbi:MAG: hypothetical protein K0S47_4333 [Herbinix sp.]|jgi:hypothetical protein|nr:hypothetical protein [Herbinix sp.]